MTFDQWIQDHRVTMCNDYCGYDVIKFMGEAWKAAIENNKPVAKIIERKLYGNRVEYSIIGYDGYESAIHDTKEEVEKWAIENGYRLE